MIFRNNFVYMTFNLMQNKIQRFHNQMLTGIL